MHESSRRQCYKCSVSGNKRTPNTVLNLPSLRGQVTASFEPDGTSGALERRRAIQLLEATGFTWPPRLSPLQSTDPLSDATGRPEVR